MPTKKLTAGQGQNLIQFTTNPFLPGANRLVVVFVMNRRAAGPTEPSLAGNNLTWVKVQSFDVGQTRLSCFRSMGPAPSATGLTITFPQQQTICAWSVFEYDGVVTAGAFGEQALIQSKVRNSVNTAVYALQLDNPLDSPASIVVGGIALSVNNDVLPGLGCTEIDEVRIATDSLQTQDRIAGGLDVNWAWASPASCVAIALELKAAPPAPPPPPPKQLDVEALVRNFEPILFLHPQESFVPSDAKRYIEHSALWRARLPRDTKSSWGGDTPAPFPRTAVIKAGSIAAVDGEPGTYLGLMPPESRLETWFLELGGWKDAAGNDQPDVTITSQNSYANRAKIKGLYESEQSLDASRFWYHAEFFDEARLTRLLQGVAAPDLLKVLGKRKAVNGNKEVALLCYYLFFPAHEESLGAGCDNVEAKEFACFAGEWQCLTLLLQRDGPDGAFVATHVGHTGRQVLDSVSGLPVLGQASDPGESATRMTMRVSAVRWDERTGHQRVFVAKGTHSLYPDADPVKNGHQPPSYECGRNETGTVVDGGVSVGDVLGPIGAFYGKILAGAAANGLLGLAVPVAAAAGVAWALAESDSWDDPFTADTGDAAEPDLVAPAGAGLVIHPVGMTAPATWPKHQAWRSVQGLIIGQRRYDFLVDRAQQCWWPANAEGRGHYGGHWGPLVEKDPFGRRAGMRFPDFWKLFFLALEDGGF